MGSRILSPEDLMRPVVSPCDFIRLTPHDLSGGKTLVCQLLDGKDIIELTIMDGRKAVEYLVERIGINFQYREGEYSIVCLRRWQSEHSIGPALYIYICDKDHNTFQTTGGFRQVNPARYEFDITGNEMVIQEHGNEADSMTVNGGEIIALL